MRRLAVRVGVGVAIGVVLCVWFETAPQGHHSISGAYDDSKRVTVQGVVDQFQFINPHPFVIVDVTEAGRPPASWRLELDNRSELARAGVTPATLQPGDRVVIVGSPSRTQANSLYVRRLERPADGFLYEQIGASPRVTTRPR